MNHSHPRFLVTALLAFAAFAGCASGPGRHPQSDVGNPGTPGAWTIDMDTPYASGARGVGALILRTGYRQEAGERFRGCVLYLEGLGDSMLNHDPYFDALNRAGYRVLAFDYMGQGGSAGSMNDTRLRDGLAPGLEIASIARKVWDKYRADCGNSRRVVIGWSTGGLAAYGLAEEGWAQAVVLLAPGTHPRALVGEAARHPTRLATGSPVITRETLTRATYADGPDAPADPHIDPVRPDSPSRVPLFVANLLLTARASHRWRISPSVPGLVFLGGRGDTYVDVEGVAKGLAEEAPQFKIVRFPDARHELDNELPDVAAEVRSRTVEFLQSLEK